MTKLQTEQSAAKQYIEHVYAQLEQIYGHETEFLQAVEEIFLSLEPVFD